MDPLTALSLACNAITVIDAAVKTGKTIGELYKSSNGFTKDVTEMINTTSQLEKALGSLNTARKLLAGSQTSNPHIAGAVNHCEETIKSIYALLDKCRAKKPSSITSALRAVYLSRYESELDKLQSDMQSATQNLMTHLTIATQTEVVGIRRLLDVADTRQALLAQNLCGLGDQLLAKDYDNSKVLEDIKGLVTLFKESSEAINHAAILRSLRPATANQRFDEIADPAADTFKWIIEQPQLHLEYHPDISTEFVEWLKSGSGVFHITGKPGCGKSTLMKCLATHPMTCELLREWASADNKEVIFSRFFFWKPGTEEQRTMRGLYRGIIYEAVKGNAAATALLFPEHWFPDRYISPNTPAPDIDSTQLELAFNKLLNDDKILAQYKICIFIDGLDDFDEPASSLWKLANHLNTWTTRGNMKLCISSREEPSILSAFPCSLRITLHALTKSDIQALVEDRLGSNPYFILLTQSSDAARKEGRYIKEIIVQHAEGVFLWVVLLLRWMEDELATGTTSLGALWNIIETAPPELNQVFARILESIPKYQQRGAYFVFAMMLRVRGHCISSDHRSDEFENESKIRDAIGIPIFELSYIFDAFEGKSRGTSGTTARFQFPVMACTDENEYRLREAQATTKLQSWCKGLATVCDQEWLNRDVQVATFTHRSIPEFLVGTFRDTAKKWNVDDDWVTEGILTTSLAATKAQYLTAIKGPLFNTHKLSSLMEMVALTTPAPSAPTVFAMLDEIDAARQQQRQEALKRGRIGSLWPDWLHTINLKREDFAEFDPVLAIAIDCTRPLTGYVLSRLKNAQAWHVVGNSEPSYDSKRLLLTLCAVVTRSWNTGDLYRDEIATILETLVATGLRPNIEVPSLADSIKIDEWMRHLSLFAR